VRLPNRDGVTIGLSDVPADAAVLDESSDCVAFGPEGAVGWLEQANAVATMVQRTMAGGTVRVLIVFSSL
jgi:hypothetical protein